MADVELDAVGAAGGAAPNGSQALSDPTNTLDIAFQVVPLGGVQAEQPALQTFLQQLAAVDTVGSGNSSSCTTVPEV